MLQFLQVAGAVAGAVSALWAFGRWSFGPSMRQTMREEINGPEMREVVRDEIRTTVNGKIDRVDDKVDQLAAAVARIEGQLSNGKN